MTLQTNTYWRFFHDVFDSRPLCTHRADRSCGRNCCAGCWKTGMSRNCQCPRHRFPALTNPYFAYDGLRLLGQEFSADYALKRVIANDTNAHKRQVGVVDNQGRIAAWTGSEVIQWAGHLFWRGCSVQGNRLAGPEVLERAQTAMHQTEHLDLAERLTLALLAGAEAGGDLEGERSVNVLVFSEEEYALCDIRIDDHDVPMMELRRLFRIYKEQILPIVNNVPKRKDIPRPC